MFGTLIESHPTRQRRRGSAALSAVVHAAIIAGALAMTPPHRYIDFSEPPRRERVVYLPPSEKRPGTIVETRPQFPTRRVCECILLPPTIPVPGPVDLGAPTLDQPLATAGSDFGNDHGPLVSNPFAPSGRGGGDLARVYTGPQVEREVAVVAAPRPAYPEVLRAAGVEGRVVARFVVDTSGRVEPSSIVVLESTHPLFERAVRDALLRVRFAPAEVAGRHVRQLVEMPFAFTLSTAEGAMPRP